MSDFIYYVEFLKSYAPALQGIGAVVSAIAVVYGALQAVKIFGAQKQTELRIHKAQELLDIVYSSRIAMHSSRSPFSDKEEADAAKIKLEKKTDLAVQAQVFLNRFVKHKETLTKLHYARNHTRAWFKEPLITELIIKLYAKIVSVQVDIEMMASHPIDWFFIDISEEELSKQTCEFRMLLYGDDVAEEIDAIVSDIEDHLFPVLGWHNS